MGTPSDSERTPTAAVSRWKPVAAARAWSMGALACSTLRVGLSGAAAAFEVLARAIRAGAARLERAAVGARARANPAPPAEAAPAPVDPVPAADKTIVAADKTIVAASPFLAAAPPALPPPRPNWGRGPVLPPPRRTEWRAALEAKRPTGEAPAIAPAAPTEDVRSGG
jgi:hypothetical protein